MAFNIRSTIWLITLGSITLNALGEVFPYLSFRSVSENAARELVGWQTQINKADMKTCYGLFTITPEYLRSFQARHIAELLFCGSLVERTCNFPNLAFKVQGSKVLNRDQQAWLADYFYLPTDFESTININPKIDTFLVDFNLYVGFDTWVPGLFFRAHAPMTNTRWDLRFCEGNITSGINGYDPGYFNDTFITNTAAQTIIGIPRNDLLNNFEQFIFGQKSITGIPTINYEPLRNARMSSYRLTKSRLAEIQLAFGYNFLLDPNYHLGLELRGYIPTGNEPHGEFLFEPIVGNGHHAELGLGLTSHWGFWYDDCNARNLSIYLDANFTHMFKSCQRRTFDLRDKPLSRYMLAMATYPPTENLIADVNNVQITPESQFKNKFTPVANLTTIPVDVSVALQADIALKLAFTSENFQWDVGYDFWYKSREKIVKRSDCCCLNKLAPYWALKGDSFVFGFPQQASGAIGSSGVPLAVSQSQSTIFNGTNNWPDGIDTIAWNQNPGIDTPNGPAFNGSDLPLVTHQLAYSPVWNQVYTSVKPVVITDANFDLKGAQTKGLSNKIFTHLNYTCNACSAWIPFFGIGGEVEFGKNSRCHFCSLSQWGLWIKGGLTFAGTKN